MKKFVLTLLMSLALALGFVAATGSGAQAACPYTGCVATQATVTGTTALKRGNNPRFTITIDVVGNAQPKGFVKLTIRRKGGGFSATRNVYYSGDSKTIVGPKLRKLGTYVVTIRFIPKAGSAYKSSTDSKVLKVKR